MEKNLERPQWFSIKEACEYLQIGEPTLYRWMRAGLITFRKVGDSTRFLQQDLEGAVEVHPSSKGAQMARLACPLCHSDRLAEGQLQSTGRVSFKAKKTRFWTLQLSHVDLEARMCLRCGTVTLFGDAQKLGEVTPDEKQETEES